MISPLPWGDGAPDLSGWAVVGPAQLTGDVTAVVLVVRRGLERRAVYLDRPTGQLRSLPVEP